MNMPVIVPAKANLAAYQNMARDIGGILQTDGKGHTVIDSRKIKGYVPVRTGYKTDPLEAA